ncbi:MAG: 50S ribosomal protein L6 [Phycisphaerae bacterium]|nr:50S ribosomal protein L6 [Phycisphaerae bacterium]
MSRIGNKPVPVPEKVKVAVKGTSVEVEGPKGKLAWTFNRDMTVAVEEGPRRVVVKRPSDHRRHRAVHGLTRAIIANMVKGVTEGYEKQLELYGTGYSLALKGKELVIHCGFAQPVEKSVPEGLEVSVETPNTRGNDIPAKMTVRGCDKQQVGEFAAEVRHLRPPEPYQGKGFRYAGERIRRKAGKTFVSGAAGA